MNLVKDWSTRAELVYKRSYARPKNEDGTELETWPETVERVIQHQAWLWERAAGLKEGSLLSAGGRRASELRELKRLLLDRKAMLAGRTMWLGGTDLVKKREIANFNCSFGNVETVHDLVDAFWLLLNGSGVGFSPKSGTLNGFSKRIDNVEIIRSERKNKGGRETNVETWNNENKTWTISTGDTGEAWAKAVGKLLAGKYPAENLVLDLSQIRPAGGRLGQYGYISAGDEVMAQELPKIVAILNKRATQLLSKIDILDIMNHLGAIQTGRRGAESSLLSYGDPEWKAFATAKLDYWKTGNEQRAQSNNSLVFYEKPTLAKINEVLETMLESGGSEPGLVNGQAALKRAPYFSGLNPCFEILLSSKGLCNLCTIDLAKFKNDPEGLRHATEIVARANYRQTGVELRDGMLQDAWHQNNQFLRLCGVGLTGIARRPDMSPYDFRQLRGVAIAAANSMAKELGTPLPANVTCIKPEGTGSKVLDTTEGISIPEGRYIFNNVNFSRHDPVVGLLREAGYNVVKNPLQDDAVLVTLPVEWRDIPFQQVDGVHVNTETALGQLERYRLMMDCWVDHNCSITVKYKPEELKKIGEWLDRNWDSYVGVSFLLKQDGLKKAEDLGYAYLPQEVVSEKKYREYAANLKPVNVDAGDSIQEVLDDGCESGACPVR